MADHLHGKSKPLPVQGSNMSLYEMLQENKNAQLVEFYEESKTELSGRNLTEEDTKFLMAVEEAKRKQELTIENQNEAALHKFRIRHELLSRKSQLQESETEMIEPVRASLLKINEKVRSSILQTSSSESTIKSKRNLLGISPKSTNK